MSDDQLLTTVRRWIALDPDPTTREQLQELVDSADGERAAATLRELFAGRLTFGTAGVRHVEEDADDHTVQARGKGRRGPG